MMQERKRQLRHVMAAAKKRIGKQGLVDLSVNVIRRLEDTTFFQCATSIALYHSLPDEVSTLELIEKWRINKKIFLPVVDGNDLRFYRYSGPQSLHEGAYGIMEPDEEPSAVENMDLIVVPGVAFDRKGNRLGRGKGFYDRFLHGRRVKKVGICFNFQLIDTIPVDPFDCKMDCVITESETIEI